MKTLPSRNGRIIFSLLFATAASAACAQLGSVSISTGTSSTDAYGTLSVTGRLPKGGATLDGETSTNNTSYNESVINVIWTLTITISQSGRPSLTGSATLGIQTYAYYAVQVSGPGNCPVTSAASATAGSTSKNGSATVLNPIGGIKSDYQADNNNYTINGNSITFTQIQIMPSVWQASSNFVTHSLSCSGSISGQTTRLNAPYAVNSHATASSTKNGTYTNTLSQ